jgi:hypothetical protein
MGEILVLLLREISMVEVGSKQCRNSVEFFVKVFAITRNSAKVLKIAPIFFYERLKKGYLEKIHLFCLGEVEKTDERKMWYHFGREFDSLLLGKMDSTLKIR